MSTNSSIILKINGDEYHSIYCHFDGYVKHVGVILYKYYKTYKKVSELISYGSVSCLEKHISKCIFYHRDMGYELTIMEHMYIPYNMYNYNYLFDGEWFLIDYRRWNPIKGEIEDMGTTKLIDVFKYELEPEHPLMLNNRRKEKIKRLGITQKV